MAKQKDPSETQELRPGKAKKDQKKKDKPSQEENPGKIDKAGKQKDSKTNLKQGKNKDANAQKSLSEHDMKVAARKTKNDQDEIDLKPGLYVFSEITIHPRDGQGPLVEPTFNIPKASGKKEMYLGNEWQDAMKSINTPVAFGRIIAKDWGPSKGINNKGLLKYNALVYPGRNIVRILQIQKGKNGNLWGLVDTLDGNSTPSLDGNSEDNPHPEYDSPHHFHTVYSCTKAGSWFLQTEAPVVPVLHYKGKENEQGQWIQMEKLKTIDLPRSVTVTDASGVGLYAKPGDLTIKNADLAMQDKVDVTELVIAKGGIWGGTDKGWIPLRFNDKNPTDWII